MHCPHCGTDSAEGKFCPECGGSLTLPNHARPDPLFGKKSANRFWFDWSKSRKATFVIVMALSVIAALNGQNLVQFLVGVATNGQVTLNASKVESSIESGIQDQLGEVVTATCPSPLAGRVGETRQCTLVDSVNSTYIVDITIQNSNGDITWKVQP